MKRLGAVVGLMLVLVAARSGPVQAQDHTHASPGAAEQVDALAQSVEAQDSLEASPLWDPGRAGRPVGPRGARDNDENLKAIEHRLRCTCSCNLDVYTCRTTDFTCATSPAMHARVLEMYEAGTAPEEIIDDFVAAYGEIVLMAPKKEGFNIVGYLMPFIALALGLTGLVWFIRTRIARAAAVSGEAGHAVDVTAVSPEDMERLNEELKNFSA